MEIKCPFCKGEANRIWLSHIDSSKPDLSVAVFVVECWSGDLNKLSNYHYFEARIRLLKTQDINQIAELEKEIKKLKRIVEK